MPLRASVGEKPNASRAGDQIQNGDFHHLISGMVVRD